MKNLYRKYAGILVSLVLIVAFTTGCMGMGTLDIQPGIVTSLQTGGTLAGMRQVIAEGVGTMILMKDNLIFMSWVRPGAGYNFIVLDFTKRITMKNFVEVTGGQATVVKSYLTFSELRDDLIASGFKKVTVRDLPPAIVTAIAASGSWIAQMAGSMTTFVFMPIVCETEFGNVCGVPVKTKVS